MKKTFLKKGKEVGIHWETGINIRALPCVKQIANGNLLDRAVKESSSLVLYGNLKGCDGDGRREVKGKGKVMYIHN